MLRVCKSVIAATNDRYDMHSSTKQTAVDESDDVRLHWCVLEHSPHKFTVPALGLKNYTTGAGGMSCGVSHM